MGRNYVAMFMYWSIIILSLFKLSTAYIDRSYSLSEIFISRVLEFPIYELVRINHT